MVEIVTFKPLARGRFRCNIKNCGAVVKQGRLDTHRGFHKNRPTVTELPMSTLKTVELWYGRARCPYCDRTTYPGKSGVVICFSCEKKFMAV